MSVGGENPRALARELGITVRGQRHLSFRVGTHADGIVYGWHPDPRIRDARIWEGIAQCILTRAGVAWSEDYALSLAARMKLGLLQLH
jgi:hypothetical protein